MAAATAPAKAIMPAASRITPEAVVPHVIIAISIATIQRRVKPGTPREDAIVGINLVVHDRAGSQFISTCAPDFGEGEFMPLVAGEMVEIKATSPRFSAMWEDICSKIAMLRAPIVILVSHDGFDGLFNTLFSNLAARGLGFPPGITVHIADTKAMFATVAHLVRKDVTATTVTTQVLFTDSRWATRYRLGFTPGWHDRAAVTISVIDSITENAACLCTAFSDTGFEHQLLQNGLKIPVTALCIPLPRHGVASTRPAQDDARFEAYRESIRMLGCQLAHHCATRISVDTDGVPEWGPTSFSQKAMAAALYACSLSPVGVVSLGAPYPLRKVTTIDNKVAAMPLDLADKKGDAMFNTDVVGMLPDTALLATDLHPALDDASLKILAADGVVTLGDIRKRRLANSNHATRFVNSLNNKVEMNVKVALFQVAGLY